MTDNELDESELLDPTGTGEMAESWPVPSATLRRRHRRALHTPDGTETSVSESPAHSEHTDGTDGLDAVLDALGLDDLGSGVPDRLVSGVVVAISGDIAKVELRDGRTGTVARSEWFPNREWAVGQSAVFGERGHSARPSLTVTHPEMVELLLDGHCREVRCGQVRVMRIARDPGVRSKVAVCATGDDVDPVAACVGIAGSRIRAVGAALGGERVEVVAWHPEMATFISNSLGPYGPISVERAGRRWKVSVPPQHLVGARGGGGVNARLTSALVGSPLSVVSK